MSHCVVNVSQRTAGCCRCVTMYARCVTVCVLQCVAVHCSELWGVVAC